MKHQVMTNPSECCITLVVALLLGLGNGCGKTEAIKTAGPGPVGSSDWVVENSSTNYLPAAPPQDAPTVKTTVKEFKALHSEDKEAFKKKFEGKWIEITGTISDINVEIRGMYGDKPLEYAWPRIFLAAKIDEAKPGTASNLDVKTLLRCYAPGEQPWNQVSDEQTVTLRGAAVIDSYGGLDLQHCTVISTDGTPTPQFTVKELVTQFQSAPDDLWKKYDGKQIIVKGVVKKPGNKASLGSTDISIALSGDSGPDIAILPGPGLDEELPFEKVKAGDELLILGECDVETKPSDDQYSLGIRGALRIDIVTAKPE